MIQKIQEWMDNGMNFKVQTDEEKAVLAKLKVMFDECFTYNIELHQKAREAHNFYYGEPFNSAELRQMRNKKLTVQNHNIIQKNINAMVGLQEMNKNRAKVRPYEQNDSDLANIQDMILDWSLQQAKAYEKSLMGYKDSLLGGLGYLIPYIDYERDLLNGELKISFEPYSNVFIDPMVKEKDFSDSRYMIIRKAVPIIDLLVNYEEKEQDLKNLSGEYIADSSVNEEAGLKNIVSVKEYWYKEVEEVFHVYIEGEIVRFNKKEYEESKQQLLEQVGEDAIVKTNGKVIKYAVVANDSVLLYDGYSPYGDNYIPVIPFIGFCDMSAEKLYKKFWGLVEPLKDVQRDKNRTKINRRYAQNATLQGGWFYTKGSIDDPRLLSIGMGMQSVAVNQGHNPPSRIPAPQYPSYLFQEENKSDEDKLTIGLNADALGLGNQSVDSSKAVSLRQQASITTVAEVPANFSIALRLLAKVCLDMVMRNITPEKVQRIVGQDYNVTPEVFATLMEREFDIFIDESTYNPTHKQQVLSQFVEYMQYSGQPVPFKTYLRFAELDPAVRDEAVADFEQQQQMQIQMQMAQAGVIPEQPAEELVQ